MKKEAKIPTDETMVMTQANNGEEGWAGVLKTSCDALFQTALLLTADPKAAEASVLAGIEGVDLSTAAGNDLVAGVQKEVATYAIHAVKVAAPSGQATARSMLQSGLWPVLEIEHFPRVCLVVRLLMGYTTSLCAQMLGINEAEVKALLMVAMRQLSRASKGMGASGVHLPDWPVPPPFFQDGTPEC